MRYYSLLLIAALWDLTAAVSPLGCYSLLDTDAPSHSDTFQSFGKCSTICASSPYLAVQENACFCLSSLPSGNKVADSMCSTPCPGFGLEICGSDSSFSVYRGLGPLVVNPEGSNSARKSTSSTPTAANTAASSSPPTAEAPSLLPATHTDSSPLSSSSTSLSTSSNSSSPSSNAKDPSLKKVSAGPIAGGVIGGIIAGVGVAFLVWFLVRRYRNNSSSYELEDEAYFDKGDAELGLGLALGSITGPPAFSLLGSRKASPMDMPLTNPFANPPNSSISSSLNPTGSDVAAGGAGGLVDPRMNQAMMGRQRLSESLLADEADYLRKILQIVNPEGS